MQSVDYRLPFPDLTGRGINVAIVDSGIDADHPGIGAISGGTEFSLEPDDRIVTGTDYRDCAGHGTACAGIVRKKAPDANLFSIRIFDESLGTDGRLLVAALHWAAAHGMDVVNLSLGTSDVTSRERLAAACRRACDAGVILVAADHNEGVESYPAVFPEVIGVAAGRFRGRYSYAYRAEQAIECVARGDEQRLCWLRPREIMSGGTSFAAPHIAGIVALILEAHPRASLEKVREILQANATEGDPELARLRAAPGPPGPRTVQPEHPALATEPIEVPQAEAVGSADAPGTHASGKRRDGHPASGADSRPSDSYAWIRRAALYPFNKEMHGFVRYLGQLAFEITGVADPVGKGLVGRDAGEAIGLPPVGIRVVPRLQKALVNADTLILGYVDQLGRIARRDILRECIQAALDQGAHVFSFLPVLPTVYPDLFERAREKGLRIVYPSIPRGEVQELLRKPPEDGPVDVPVLGVFGTSAQQGKFTLQLALRRRLMARGYRLGQIGTEHQSELFGMDFAFPMGYASPLDIPLQYYAPYLDLKMREVCHRKRPDLVLVGSQSGTIPYDVEEHSTHSLPSLAFLLGTKPDACILVVNSIDPDEYIEHTLDAIRALAKAPTLLLAMSDKEKHVRAAYGRSWITPRQMSREEIDTKLGYLEDRFGLPAVEILSEEGQERAVETVIGFFAAEGAERSDPAAVA